MPSRTTLARDRRRGSTRAKGSKSRLQIAQAVLGCRTDTPSAVSTTATFGTPRHAVSDSLDSGFARSGGGRGQALGGLTSPPWRGLVVAVSRSLAQRCSEAALDCEGRRSREAVEWVHADSAGGGSQMEIHLCFRGALETMELSDASAASVLVGAYYYLQAEDVVLTTRSWRSLVVTSLLAAASVLCEGAERERAVGKLRRVAACWWSEAKVNRALQVFRLRDAFVQDPLSEQKISALYSELHAQQADPLHGGSGPGSASLELPPHLSAKRNVHAKATKSWSSRNGDLADRSGDGYASDQSVISI